LTTRTNPPTTEPAWRVIDHTADIRVEVCGSDLEQLFLNAAQALNEILGAGEPVGADHDIEISLESPGLDELLVDWLREILFYNQTRGWVFVQAHVEHLSDTSFRANASFGLRREEDEPEFEIKAVTYHGLTVEKSDCGYCAKILFDI
jgi:SHS2 domain-containing protein